jgi:hypothetical protein
MKERNNDNNGTMPKQHNRELILNMRERGMTIAGIRKATGFSERSIKKVIKIGRKCHKGCGRKSDFMMMNKQSKYLKPGEKNHMVPWCDDCANKILNEEDVAKVLILSKHGMHALSQMREL